MVNITVKDKVNKTFFIIFSIYLFGVLTFGRSFSLLNYRFPNFPLFVTEIILIFGTILIVYNYKIINELSKALIAVLSIWFVFGVIYYVIGIMKNNFFVFKDIVYFGYALFLPLMVILLKDYKKFKFFFLILVSSNLIELFLGRLFIFKVFPNLFFINVLEGIKPVNFSLNYGIAIIFLLALGFFSKRKYLRVVTYILISINFYMVVMVGGRSLLLGLLVVFGFLFCLIKRDFLKTLLFLTPVIIFIVFLLFSLDKHSIDQNHMQTVCTKVKSMLNFNKLLSLKREIPRTTFLTSKNKPVSGQKVSDYLLSLKNDSLPVKVQFQSQGPSEAFWESLGSAREKEAYSNIYWRLVVWKQAIEFGLVSPLFGRGFGIYPKYMVWSSDYLGYQVKQQYFNTGIVPVHNHLITIFYKMGLLGLGLFLFICIYIFVSGVKFLKKCKSDFLKLILIGCLGCLVFWHTLAFFFDIIDSPATSIFLWVISGLIFATGNIIRKEDEASR